MASIDLYQSNPAPCRPRRGVLVVLVCVLMAAAPCTWAQQGVAAAAALAQPPQDPAYRTLELLYTKFLSAGRSDVEIHLSPSGEHSGARIEPNGDGSFTCHVFGLQTPAGEIDSRPSMRMLAGTLVHEATHCLVTPYALGIRPDADDPASHIAGSLVLLTLESISDARAVIELYRKDGIEAAREFAALMLPHRLMAASLGHSTAPALRAALQLVCTEPGTIQDDERAFGAALRIGRTGAEYAFQRFARGTGRSQQLETPGFKAVSTALEAALERAALAFHSGRYENNAATLRASDMVASAGDYHFFIDTGGKIRTEPALGMEGVRSAASIHH
ncbi:MAG TPA: hypothetical protein VFL86_06565 [Burkholderiaceae bacterium]|nr:hypothetical protein [Burkholderiaceae bacterium]